MRESFIVGVLAVGICSQAAAERREHTKSTRGAEAAAIHTSGACFRLLNRLAGRSVRIMAASYWNYSPWESEITPRQM